MDRVVSLLPSTTEIVHALGCGDRLVGRSHECDHPAGVERLPIVTEPKAPMTGTSAEVDRQVRTILEQALSVYRVHTDVLVELDPTVVLTQSQCEVCAVSADEVQQAVDVHLDGHAEVVALEPNGLADVYADVRRVAVALGVPERGEQLVADMTARIDAVTRRTADLPRRRVLTLEWIEPLMAAGNWMPELLAAAGGQELFGVAGRHSPWLEFDAVRAADPEVIVILPCGFDLPRTREEAAVLRELPGWSQLRAVREGRVALTDGNRFFNRPGPRLAESTEILAEILHPDVVAPAHRGDAWEPFPTA
ncbi:cobalamin-binding protein [Egicoccus halophilus]|uniref:Cobalamin-binding protein n=1 Tax=Egicoccus halophilus TaxID=1670830 RepID=A0A8J3AAU7_9ACTN|nr:cobalamin-binding protein [Egicoccus halophilus]GGI06949.1 cobalamin-binding protein [Egicoccus halophilus]